MYYIGVDLGGTKIAAGLLNESGDILFKKSVPTIRTRHYSEILKDLANLCLDIINENNISLKDIHCIGVGSPGSCDFDNGILLYSNNIKFKDTPLVDEIKKTIDLPVYLDNDANCAAYGENIKGACKGTKNNITITLGTGVGSGVIVDGKVLRGSNGIAGEIGHHAIIAGGELCTCGRKGCFEAYGSATALIRDVKRAAIKNPNSLINNEINNNFDLITAKTVFDAKDKGDNVAKEVIDNYMNYLAEGFANIINIFQPEVMAVGGGVAEQGEKILAPIREKTKKLCYGDRFDVKIVKAELGNDAGIIGAAFLGKNI